MSGENTVLVIFMTLVVGSILGVILLSYWKPEQEGVSPPVNGYVRVDTLSSKGEVEIYVYDIDEFIVLLECGFPTLTSIKTYIETGYCESLQWRGNFLINTHVWVGICRGELTSIDERRYSEGYYLANNVRDYLQEVYDYNNLGEYDVKQN